MKQFFEKKVVRLQFKIKNKCMKLNNWLKK